MKKILTAILALITVPSIAQITGDGYYRVQNNGTERYITITDDIIGGVDMSATTVDLTNITTWRGFDNVKSNPASIIYINKVNTKYDLASQGISVHEIAEGKAYVDLIDCTQGIYIIGASAKGFTKYLYDVNGSKDYSSVTDYGDEANRYWRIKPLDTTDNYIGFTPTLQTNEGWYGTFYAAFPFKVASEDVHVYIVDGVKEGIFQMKEITDDIKPASTPMIIKCSTNDAARNQIIPVVATTSKPGDNLLNGTFFCSFNYLHEEYVKFDTNNMRVLGLNDSGELVLTKDNSSLVKNMGKYYIPANTAYLYDAKGLSGEYKLVSRDEFTGIHSIEATSELATKGTFTLSGVKVDDSKTLSPGIYIKNGKKVVIK